MTDDIPMYYILKGRKVVPVTVLDWARWFKTFGKKRIVKQSEGGNYRISTVFVGIDHNLGHGPPLLFETMVFKSGSYDDKWMDRCSTYKEALEMHKQGIAWAVAHMEPINGDK